MAFLDYNISTRNNKIFQYFEGTHNMVLTDTEINDIIGFVENSKYWDNLLYDMTPVEKVSNMWFKREDEFCPMGYGGINGSKLRQLIWLISNAKNTGAKGVLSGSVTGSPQHIMTAAVAKHYGLPCILVANTTNIDKYPMLKLSKEYGAEFRYSSVGYAKTLESKAFQLQKEDKYKDYYVIEMNISASEKRNTATQIRKFHEVGAWQVRNIPKEVDTLIIPCGSCNSVTSILYGLYLHEIHWVKKIILMGIGNIGSKNINYIYERLDIINKEARNYALGLNTKYYNLNGEGFCKYEDLMPFSYHEIEFHPRYEGKIMTYLSAKELSPTLCNGKTLFWIVGSEPKF